MGETDVFERLPQFWHYFQAHPYASIWVVAALLPGFLVWSATRALEHRYAVWLNERIDELALRVAMAVRHMLRADRPFVLTLGGILGLGIAAYFSLSGIAAAVLIVGIPALVMVATARGDRSPWQPTLEFNPEPPGGFDRLHHLDPRRIFHDINRQPPLQRAEAARSYVGQVVDWVLVWTSGDRDERNPARLRLWFQCGALAHPISAEVDAATYPQFHRLPERTPVRVRGTIESVERSIRLRDITVQFDLEPPT